MSVLSLGKYRLLMEHVFPTLLVWEPASLCRCWTRGHFLSLLPLHSFTLLLCAWCQAKVCPGEPGVVPVLKTSMCTGREWKVNSQCFNGHAVAGDSGGREQGKGRRRASLVAALWAQAWVLSFPRVGSKWVTRLPFSYKPALATRRPWCENHDEHLDASEGLSPDNHHREREECTHEARALCERPGRRPRNWVTFTERNSFCCLGNICLVGWTLIFEVVPLTLWLKYFNQIYIS